MVLSSPLHKSDSVEKSKQKQNIVKKSSKLVKNVEKGQKEDSSLYETSV